MPSWTMTSSKPPEKHLNNSPGPGAYNNDYSKLKEKARACPILGRHAEQSTVGMLPGPGQYNPSKDYVNQKNTYNISFGARP